MALPVVFVHGSGRAGADNWPVRQIKKWKRVSRYPYRPGWGPNDAPVPTDMAAEQALIVDEIEAASASAGVAPAKAHLVAHSSGAVAASLVAASRPDLVASLTLIEPALYALARGNEAIEAHVSALEPVYARANELDAGAFIVEFFTALGQEGAKPPTTPETQLAAERWRLMAPMWEFEVPEQTFASTPTLVVTGGWNAEYEAIAERLVELGAERAQIKNGGHRPQDHLLTMGIVHGFIGASEAAAES